jgi:hypothetical protein
MQTWYHGSPLQLDILRVGSTITPLRHVAEVFSHKPVIVSIADDGTILHNGHQQGLLYVIDEALGDADIYPHPRTTMQPGVEWLTRRDLRLRLNGPVDLVEGELLGTEDEAALRARMRSGG